MGRLGRKESEESSAHEAAGMMRWLLTYADMLTLLFVLFVVLFAISKVNMTKFITVTKAIQKSITNQSNELTQAEIEEIVKRIESRPQAPAPPQPTTAQEDALESLNRELTAFVEQQNLSKAVEIKKDKRGIIIRLLTDNVLFDLGRAELRTKAKQILHEFVKIIKLAKIENIIRIEGHTDNIPLLGGGYKDNWGLSVARAASVLRFLIEKGMSPKQLEAAGLGEYNPLVPNDSDLNRQKNRRVELIILTLKEEKEALKDKLKNEGGQLQNNVNKELQNKGNT